VNIFEDGDVAGLVNIALFLGERCDFSGEIGVATRPDLPIEFAHTLKDVVKAGHGEEVVGSQALLAEGV
jgi:hypothetical protein